MVTAALVFLSIQWLAVRPIKRLTANMVAFQKAPQDSTKIMHPGERTDEVGIAERALTEMQGQLRTALMQQERLADVGTAVTKVSHDLKNILATAMLESDRLEQSADPEVRRITSGLVKAIDRAIHLCTKTLRFAKEGPPRVEKSEISLKPYFAEIKSALEPVLDGCGVVFRSNDTITISADADLLRRAIENLVRNAAESGATEISVDVKTAADDIFCTVSDNGPGLPKKALENLFVPFSGSARSGGSGLGLPISREAIRAQGGDLMLRESSSDGAIFEILLPT